MNLLLKSSWQEPYSFLRFRYGWYRVSKKAHFFFCKLPDNVEAVVEITSLKEDITQLSKKDASESMQTLKTPTKLSPALGVISNDDYVVVDNNDSSSNNIDLKNCPRDKNPFEWPKIAASCLISLVSGPSLKNNRSMTLKFPHRFPLIWTIKMSPLL